MIVSSNLYDLSRQKYDLTILGSSSQYDSDFIKDWDKKKGLEELDKIFIFFNYTVQTIRSISNNSLID